MLVNMATGGDGHIAAWIERVTLDGAAPGQQTAHVYHVPAMKLPNGQKTQAATYLGTLDYCRRFYMLPYLELPATEQPDINAVPIEDNGRHIPAAVWQKRYNTMQVDD